MSHTATRGTPPIGVGTGLNTQGMVAPVNPFVDGDGVLAPVSFRFLFNLLQRVAALEGQVATINQRLANAGIP